MPIRIQQLNRTKTPTIIFSGALKKGISKGFVGFSGVGSPVSIGVNIVYSISWKVTVAPCPKIVMTNLNSL
jgi:hypothetical protein